MSKKVFHGIIVSNYMEPLTIVIALLLMSCGLAVLFYLLRIVFPLCFGWINLSKDGIQFRRAVKRVEKADQLIEQKQFEAAIIQLRKAIYLGFQVSRPKLSAFRDHHQNIMSRCLIIAEELGGKIENIASVERLTIERGELQELLVKAKQAHIGLADRRKAAGKQTPSWTKADYNRRVNEISAQLEKNTLALKGEFEKLFASLKKGSNSESIVYH